MKPRIVYMTALLIAMTLLLFSSLSIDERLRQHRISLANNHIFNSQSETSSPSTYPGIDIISKVSNDHHIKYSVHYPTSLVGHDRLVDVADYIDELVNTFVSHSTEEIVHHRRHKQTFELNVSFEMTYASERYCSIIFHIKHHEDSELLEHTARTFLIDLHHAQEIHMSELFQADAPFEQVLTSLSAKQHDESEQTQQQAIHTTFELFTISEHGLTLYDIQEADNDPQAPIDHIFIPWIQLHNITDERVQLSDNLIKDVSTLQAELKAKDHPDNATPDDPANQQPEGDEEPMEPLPVKKIALTFDDGPDQEITPLILESLEKYNAKATFFMLGNRAEFYPDIVKQVHDAGHEIGNHSWDHPQLTNLKPAGIIEQIDRTNAVLSSIIGYTPLLVRAPYGEVNQKVRDAVSAPLINWSIDTSDWRDRDVEMIMSQVERKIDENEIILMHDTYETTAQAVEQLLEKYSEEGYVFVTVSELLEFDLVEPVNGKLYHRKQ